MDQNGGNDEFQYTGQAPAGAPSPSDVPAPDAQVAPESTIIEWKASEFIDHQKTAGWFVPLAAGIVVLSIGMFLISRSITSTLVILLGGVAFLVLAHQKPRTLTYVLTNSRIKIGDKSYGYDDFRTFSILQDGALLSVFLEPIKRFMPPISIYFPPEDAERIFDALAQHLPHQDRTADPIDRFMRRIRF